MLGAVARSADAYDKVSPTALATAYGWKQLGMPYAELFATREGAALYWSFAAATNGVVRAMGAPTLLDYLEFRHRMLEAQLARLEPDLIVELGAGLSRRGVTWVLDRGVDFVEVDLPGQVARKRRLLAEADRRPEIRGRIGAALANGRFELRASDILDPAFGDELARLFEGRARPVVVSEGLVDYLELDDRARLWTNLAAGFRRAGVEGHYLTDLQRADRERKVGAMAAVLRAAIRVVTRGQGTRTPYADLDAVARAFAEAGFEGGEELNPRVLAEDEPRLRQLRSPTTIWHGWVGLAGPVDRSVD